MKLKRIMKAYYREQIHSADIIGGKWTAEAKGRGAGSPMFNIAFHAVLMALIISAMVAGLYQPSRLERQMGIIIDRYNVEERMTDSLEKMIIIIKNNRSAGGKL